MKPLFISGAICANVIVGLKVLIFHFRVKKSTVFPVHDDMMGPRGSRGITPLILNLSTRWRWVVNFTPRLLYSHERTPVPNEWDDVWAPEMVWMFWRRIKSLVPAWFKPQFIQLAV